MLLFSYNFLHFDHSSIFTQNNNNPFQVKLNDNYNNKFEESNLDIMFIGSREGPTIYKLCLF